MSSSSPDFLKDSQKWNNKEENEIEMIWEVL